MRAHRTDGVSLSFSLIFFAVVAAWLVCASLLRGDYAAAPFLVVWLAAAALGLHAGLRKLQLLLGLARPAPPVRPAGKPRAWRDGMPERRDG